MLKYILFFMIIIIISMLIWPDNYITGGKTSVCVTYDVIDSPDEFKTDVGKHLYILEKYLDCEIKQQAEDPDIVVKLIKSDFEEDGVRLSSTTAGRPMLIEIDEGNWRGDNRSGLSIDEYKQYVILHEFLHAFGYDHQECNESTIHIVNGEKRCPIMYQSTKGPPPGTDFKCGFIPNPKVDFNTPWYSAMKYKLANLKK